MTRYLVGLWAGRVFGPAFPWGTFIVNVTGCFLIAAIMHVATTTSFELYAYDGSSRLNAASNDASFVIIARDSFGNVRQMNENGRSIGYTCDGVGNCTSITYPSGTAVGYTYDAGDQVSQITRCEDGVRAVAVRGDAELVRSC